MSNNIAADAAQIDMVFDAYEGGREVTLAEAIRQRDFLAGTIVMVARTTAEDGDVMASFILMSAVIDCITDPDNIIATDPDSAHYKAMVTGLPVEDYEVAAAYNLRQKTASDN